MASCCGISSAPANLCASRSISRYAIGLRYLCNIRCPSSWAIVKRSLSPVLSRWLYPITGIDHLFLDGIVTPSLLSRAFNFDARPWIGAIIIPTRSSVRVKLPMLPLAGIPNFPLVFSASRSISPSVGLVWTANSSNHKVFGWSCNLALKLSTTSHSIEYSAAIEFSSPTEVLDVWRYVKEVTGNGPDCPSKNVSG